METELDFNILKWLKACTKPFSTKYDKQSGMGWCCIKLCRHLLPALCRGLCRGCWVTVKLFIFTFILPHGWEAKHILVEVRQTSRQFKGKRLKNPSYSLIFSFEADRSAIQVGLSQALRAPHEGWWKLQRRTSCSWIFNCLNESVWSQWEFTAAWWIKNH